MILELSVLSTKMNGINIVNELKWLSQGGDYELDVLSMEPAEHQACRDNRQEVFCGTQISSSYSLQSSYYASAMHLTPAFLGVREFTL